MFPVLTRRRPRPEEVLAAHARLVALGLVPSHDEVTGGWVPTTTAAVADEAAVDAPPPAPRQSPALVPSGVLERLSLRPAAVVGLFAVAVIGLVVAALLAWHARARPVASVAPPSFATPAGGASPRSSAGVVVVDVAGKVRHPGLVTLPLGSRVADALRAAGGVRPGTDLTALNLARKLVDGEQIVVGATVPASGGGQRGSATTPTAPSGPLNLNTSTVADFDTLPGIGPVLAQRIVAWRDAHGGFTEVSQLRQVSGIGESKYAQLKSLVQV